MTYGPVDFLAVKFPGNQFKGEILPALKELVDNKIVRILDLIFIMKDEKGRVAMRELEQPDEDMMVVFDPSKVDTVGMIKLEDLNMVAEQLEFNSSAAVMLFENLWALKFKQALLNAQAELIMQERIPHEVVLETLADMEDVI
jgi:flagellar basal body rod protein FlgC